jgi:hypothetical protein
MKITTITTLALTLVFALSSCNKYEEGPKLSLKSKKARISNEWVIEKATRNGEDVTSSYDEFTLQMMDDGDANLAALYTFGNFSYEYETQGTWMFTDSKNNLKLDFEDNDADQEYQILKLKTDELWLRELGGEDELHLMPK